MCVYVSWKYQNSFKLNWKMIINRILKSSIIQPKFLVPVATYGTGETQNAGCSGTKSADGKPHTKNCPVTKLRKVCPGAGGLKKKRSLRAIKRGPVCPEKKESGGDDGSGGKILKRALKTGKCRMGFIPDEWFLFFKPMTGVTGPYIFMIGLGNYLLSKEIFVMEHEYYSGLSVVLVLYLITTRFGTKIGSALDDKVDAVANEFEQQRRDELALNEKVVEQTKLAIWRARGLKDLMDAKKENIAIQLEAIYRERLMLVYRTVDRRLQYQVSRRRKEDRIHRKWMIKWVLKNVYKSITPEFKKQALVDAIRDLDILARRPKK